ncbi:hypothetical protein QQ008_10310 [Fulvivirgaceae bacterium BMA10]|uniref:Uncharacterized protein n=1 Tax=Splendidivirga corallicola TaxID=3051826 RepID=A0ABT8KM08_9BACT|nr:hypothetical protein [Fulvivirgaceae bacterium BMA10]
MQKVKILVLIFICLGTTNLYAQSWIDTIEPAIRRGKATFILSNQTQDRRLHEYVDSYRVFNHHNNSLGLDSTGLYTLSKRYIDELFVTNGVVTSPGVNYNPKEESLSYVHHSGSNSIVLPLKEINGDLIKQIFEKSIQESLVNWFEDGKLSETIAQNGSRAASAIKFQIDFEQAGENTKVTWQYYSAFLITTNKTPVFSKGSR